MAAVAFFAALNVQASYDPSTGRWFSRDPIEERGGQNLFQFAKNNPIHFFDALGHRPIKVQFNAFIPGRLGSWLPEPFPGSPWFFHTDERSFGGGSSRIHAEAIIESLDIGKNSTLAGSHKTSVRHYFWADPSERRKYENGGWYYDRPAPATVHGDAWLDETKCQSLLVFNGVHAAYGYHEYLSPDIDFTAVFRFKVVGSNKLKVTVFGLHDHFPNYEGIVDGKVVYPFDTADNGPGLINLNWPMFFVSDSYTIDAETSACCSEQ